MPNVLLEAADPAPGGGEAEGSPLEASAEGAAAPGGVGMAGSGRHACWRVVALTGSVPLAGGMPVVSGPLRTIIHPLVGKKPNSRSSSSGRMVLAFIGGIALGSSVL